jgi:hypothetical protein
MRGRTRHEAGRLLAHSPRVWKVNAESVKYPNRALVVFSEDAFPHGYVAAFELLHE